MCDCMATYHSMSVLMFDCRHFIRRFYLTSCAGGRHDMPRPLQVDLRPFDLESGVPILVFLGLSVLDLGPMYARDRET